MKHPDELERSISNLKIVARATANERILADASRALQRTNIQQAAPLSAGLGRIIVKSKWTKLVAAAVLIFVAALTVTLLDNSVTPAYAIEQTIQANEGLLFLHVMNVSPPAADPQETWVELDEDGTLIRLRVEEGQGDTFRIMIWSDSKIKFYRPANKEFVVFHDTHGLQGEINRSRERVDPKYAVEQLYQLQREGKAEISIIEPEDASQPIELTADKTVHLQGKDYHTRYVLLIDQETKLVQQRDTYYMKDGDWVHKSRQQYMDYNRPIDPELFVLEAPSDVEVDDRTQGIGMPQGDMSDTEAAREVLRQYIQALVDRDYEKAARLYNRKVADELRARIEERLKIKYLRVVEIGDPISRPRIGPRGYAVPFTMEIELENGTREINGPPVKSGPGPRSHRKASVRPVPGQPDRWVVDGGI